MRVAHLTTTDLSLRYLVLAQMRAVIESGGEAVGISAPGPFTDELERAGIRHIPLPTSTRGMDLRSDVSAMLALWRVIHRERFDILHTHNPKPGIYGRVLGRLARVPCVVNTVHGLFATEDDPWVKRTIVYGLEALACHFSDAELVQNPEDLALLRRLPLYPRGRSQLLGNGIDLERFHPDRYPSSERRALRRSLGIGDGQIAVGTVGRLVVEKGYLELFDAARKLDDTYVVLAVGPEDPQKWDALDADVLDQARADGVRLLGMRDDVDAFYAALDIFVLASHREGFPRTAMEACAMGLPVVATDIRGCREIVEPGVNGLLVPVRDPGSLGAAICELGGDGAVRQAMGQAGRRRAEARFDEREVVRRVMNTYADALARKCAE